MATGMTEQQVKKIILRELPAIIQTDPEVRDLIVRLSREQYADKAETDGRFDRILDELRRDREEQSRKWDENQQAINRLLDSIVEQDRKWDEQNRKWDENQQAINRLLDSIEEQDRKWDENQQVINRMLKAIEDVNRKYDSSIGALGARWGLNSEESFRNALKAILEESFAVQVVNVNEYDDEGEVFGRPDQVELDILIKNGLLIICEIKSSMSKSDMYAFERKIRFYEKRHNRQATRRIAISPMVDDKAMAVAAQAGIEVYSYARDAKPAPPA